MKISIIKENKGVLIVSVFLLLLWQFFSMNYSELIFPSPIITFKTLVKIIRSDVFFSESMITFKRLIIGMIESILMGTVLGIAMGVSKKAKILLESLIYFMQSVPPILYMALAMIWFGLDGKATIFIIFMASMPIMAVSIKEGFESIDKNLIDMGNAFKFSKFEMLRYIILPSLKTHFKSGLVILVGLGWKLVVMGEVLSAGNGIGTQITDARMNLETNKVFAWGFIVIFLCFLSQKMVAAALDIRLNRRKL